MVLPFQAADRVAPEEPVFRPAFRLHFLAGAYGGRMVMTDWGGWPDPTAELMVTLERRLRRYVAPALDGPPYCMKLWQGAGLVLVLREMFEQVERRAPAGWAFVASMTPTEVRVALDAGAAPRLLELDASPPHDELARVVWFAGAAFAWKIEELVCRAWKITVEAGGGGFLMAGPPALRARRRRAESGDIKERRAAMVAAGVRDMLDPARRIIPLAGVLVRGGRQWVRSGAARDRRRAWRYFDEALGTLAKDAPSFLKESTAALPAPGAGDEDCARPNAGGDEDCARPNAGAILDALALKLPRQQRRFLEALKTAQTTADAARGLGLSPDAGRQLFRRIVVAARRK